MPWGLVAAAAIGAVSADQQAGAAKDAARAQGAAADAATAEQRRQYDQTRTDMMPWMNAGTSALAQMQRWNSGDTKDFFNTPDYQFRFDQGLQGLDRSAAARGGLFGGGHSADVVKYAGGMAAQGYNDAYNRLAGLSNVGQNTATGIGQFGQNAANQIGNNMMDAGRARASGYTQAAGAWGDYANSLGGMVNYGQQNQWGKNGWGGT